MLNKLDPAEQAKQILVLSDMYKEYFNTCDDLMNFHACWFNAALKHGYSQDHAILIANHRLDDMIHTDTKKVKA